MKFINREWQIHNRSVHNRPLLSSLSLSRTDRSREREKFGEAHTANSPRGGDESGEGEGEEGVRTRERTQSQ